MTDEAFDTLQAGDAGGQGMDGPGDAPEEARPGTGAALVLISVPIGNIGDICARAARELGTVERVLCEDTRRTARLLAQLGVGAPCEALHEHNEDARIEPVLARIERGARIALVSDAGTPLVSDPGYRLVRAAIARRIAVTAVPGPNAAVTALVLSGLPPQPFLFLGFAPPRQAARLASFGALHAAETAGLRATMIWHEAPHRVGEMLHDLRAVFGERPAALARELTKRFEEVRRGPLGVLAEGVRTDPPRGEITVLVGPAAEADLRGSAATLDSQLREAMTRLSLRDAAGAVAAASGLPRRTVYARALELASGEGGVEEA